MLVLCTDVKAQNYLLHYTQLPKNTQVLICHSIARLHRSAASNSHPPYISKHNSDRKDVLKGSVGCSAIANDSLASVTTRGANLFQNVFVEIHVTHNGTDTMLTGYFNATSSDIAQETCLHFITFR